MEVTKLSHEAFKGTSGQDEVQIDAAVVVAIDVDSKVLLAAEHKTTLDKKNVHDTVDKYVQISTVLANPSTCPDLADRLKGVKSVKMYLAGGGVSRRTTLEALLATATAAGVAVVLPSGKALGLVLDADM